MQKAFDAGNHKILLQNLTYFGIQGRCNDWFKSYLSDCKQFVCISGYDSDLMTVDCCVSQGFVLGPLLFLIYINGHHKATPFCQVHHFADSTNLFHIRQSVKSLNKLVNCDMKYLNVWLSPNKIWIDAEKTELSIFKSLTKVLTDKIRIKLSGKRLYIDLTQQNILV